MILRLGQGEPLDRSALGQGERRWAAAAVARVQGVEPVEIEVVEHVADPVGHPASSRRPDVAGSLPSAGIN
jgi:hypothetical protein